MVVTHTIHGSWHILTGSAAEVLIELSARGISPADIKSMAADGTTAIYKHGLYVP